MPVHRTRESLSLPSKPLEVKTDAPPPAPCLTIVSPTPRAFTFPPNVLDQPTPRAFTFPSNVLDHPITNSPSPSPFEPDMSSLAISHQPRSNSPVAPNPLLRPLDRLSGTPISIPPSRRRGSSTSSSLLDRKPKKGDEDYIKRPENAFILFRRDCCMKKNQDEAVHGLPEGEKRQRQADLSKTISQKWKSLSSEERKYWDDLAKQRKKEHEELYPWYVYQPTRTKEKKGKTSSSSKTSKSSKSSSSASSISSYDSEDFDSTTDSDSVSFYMQNGRRHSSAPTPPPMYPSNIRLPTLLSPSCPTSPSESKSYGRYLQAPYDLAQPHVVNPPQFHDAFDQSSQIEYPPDLNGSIMFTNPFETSHAPVVADSNANGRTLSALTIPTQPRNFPPPNYQVSPTHSISSQSSGPSTPQRNPFMYIQQQMSPTIQQQFSPTVQSPGSNGLPFSLPKSTHGPEQDVPKDVCPSDDWNNYGLPSWALPTLFPSGGAEYTLTDADLSGIPPLALEVPVGHDGSIEQITDPLFGLQFSFEELLDPSQL